MEIDDYANVAIKDFSLKEFLQSTGPIAFRHRLDRFKRENGIIYQLHATRGWKKYDGSFVADCENSVNRPKAKAARAARKKNRGR